MKTSSRKSSVHLWALLAVVATLAAAAPAAESTRPTGPAVLPAPINVNGFSTPESVLYDAVNDVYLVSNINGAGLDRKSTRLNSSHGGISRMPSSA